MASFVKCSSSSRRQGLFLLALVLLAVSVIPAPISGQSIDSSRKSKMMVGDNKAVIHDDTGLLNGCHYNQGVHSDADLFCCSKDNLCWPTASECAANCPCKTNCR